MDLIQSFIEKARRKPARIVYPEGGDERILKAAAMAKEAGIAEPTVLGNADNVNALAKEHKICLDGVRILTISDNDTLAGYATAYAESRGVKEGTAKRLVKKPLAFGGMMVKSNDADGMVAGVASATATVIQAASLTIGFQEGLSTPSSFFVMIIPEFLGEEDKLLVFADCAVNIQPNARQLAEIGVASGVNARTLLGMEPKIAFLSLATKGSANHADVDKVVDAVKIAQAMGSGLDIDGEMQGDAALIPAIGAKKAIGSTVAGNANVLVFPDLDAANIAYKLVERLAGAKAIGPILQGFAKPVNDMSRGASVEDIISVTAITAVQAREVN
ncbi:MAG: phosphate acetyltransferase [Kiritimatiellae bacterium]|nr:phosphate acetyltransferase [Kiritimatiellia bacterium]